MSLEIIAKLICDNCRAEIVGRTGVRSTRCWESYWDAMGKAEKNGWVIVFRGYRMPAHYCKDCADKPVVKIKDPPRKRKCRACKGCGGTMEWSGGVGRRVVCSECGGTGKPSVPKEGK